MMNSVPWLQLTNMISYQGLVRTFPKADRHVLVIATDGQPDDMASARAMIQSAKDDDIIVIGIGFGDASDRMMKSLFGDTGVSVGSVSALRSKLFEVTRKALMS
ncbi:VWA domain-containing protein [Serratia marcescens]